MAGQSKLAQIGLLASNLSPRQYGPCLAGFVAFAIFVKAYSRRTK